MSKAAIYTDKTNIKYLTNFAGSAGFVLQTPTKIYLYTDSRYSEGARSLVKKGVEVIDNSRIWRDEAETAKKWTAILKKHKIQEIGLEEHEMSISRFKFFKKQLKLDGKTLKITNISGELEKVRALKTSEEIKLLEKSQHINEQVFLEAQKRILQAAHSFLKHTPSEKEVAWWIIQLARELGADEISFEPIVAFGEHSASPHHHPTDRKLKRGDTVLIDMGMKYQGYCSDMTRTFFPWGANREQGEIHEIVLRAQLAGIAAMKPGISGHEADLAARTIIDHAGYADKFGHSTGHGIGLDVHEFPSSSPKVKALFAPGMVITVEPGIYLPGKFGVRIEDMVLITENSHRNLTKLPK